MKAADPHAFESKLAEAARAAPDHKAHMIRTTMNRGDWLILLMLAGIWGAAFFCIDIAVRDVPPLTYVWLRLTLAAAAMWAFMRFKGIRIGLPPPIWGSMFVLALLNNTLPFVLIGWGEVHIASGLAAILNAITPICGVLVAHFATHDERLTRAKVAGVVLGFIGVTVMMGPTVLGDLGKSVLAQLACVVASISYAFAAVWARRFKKQGISPLSITTGQLTAGALMMLPVALIVDHPWTRGVPPISALGAIATLALVCSAFAYVLYFRLIQTSGATNAMLVTLLVPPVAIVLGALFLGETLAPQDFVGLALIALGLAAIDGRLLSYASGRPLPRAA